MTELKHTPASIIAGFAKLITLMLAMCVVANWGRPVDYTLAIPILFVPAFIWVAFVPRRFRYGKEGFEFTSRFTGTHFLPADRFRHWGKGESVFLLEFDKQALHRRTLQIALWVYPREVRDGFKTFLKENFLERRASMWVGIRGYTWRGWPGRSAKQ